ncbi:uncharacterized protein LOC141536849 isoform X1 [Cotesia typhae]|uniref:uncharacterized protein LOC141536849 isoform X1 n=2 Tax=Cotesia typhae TaxID=2053667 RepID=UPI003D693CEA
MVLYFKMAEEPQWMTMEKLLQIGAGTVEEDRVLDRIKLLAQESLTTGWQNWKTLDLSKESLFGREQEVDPHFLYKLRFALPTVGLAQAFNPEAVDLPEKQYKDLKISMLNWSFCRALIMSPPALVNKLKGSVRQAEIFLHVIEPVKSLCISRIQAAEKLRQQVEESQSENYQGVKRLSQDTGNHSVVERSKVAALQDEMNHMFEIVFEKIQKIEQKGKKRGREESSKEEEEFESSSEPSSDDDSHSIISSAWTPPVMEDPRINRPISQPINPPVKPMNDLEALSFNPQVKEKESLIPPPTSEIKVQGIDCQKLGSASWNTMRYKEVQKKLHASPVFDSLKINTQLKGLVSESYYLTLLERMDELTGTLTHGFLKQRQYLMEGMKSLATKYPEAYNDIKEAFLSDSQFKETSDDLLQFTCGRRAEIIEMR